MNYSTATLLIVMCSCQINNDRESNQSNKSLEYKADTPKQNTYFTSYLKNFQKRTLPITIKACNESLDELKHFNNNDYSKYTDNYSVAYGILPTNGNYIATITLGAADCYLPILTTYNSDGQLIDRKTIAIGQCGAGCGFECEEFMTLCKDFSFYASDTISTYTCDSLGRETSGTYEYYVIYIKGRLLPSGKIEASNETKKFLERK